MKFEYRTTLIDRVNRTAKNITYTLDAGSWLEHIRARPSEYGNIADVVESALPGLKSGHRGFAAALALNIDKASRDINANIIFELVMYCWHGLKSGQFPAETWAGALGYGWQCGKRGMLGGVKLAQATVVEMFAAAPKSALFWVATGRDDWDDYHRSLADEIEVYRGISTHSQLQDKGFCWTTDWEQAWKFAAMNTHSLMEIPGVITAKIPKQAVLAVFDFESEITVDPTVPKISSTTRFLKGADLRKFYKAQQIGKQGRVAGFGIL